MAEDDLALTGDLRDPRQREALEQTEPEQYMRRRDFLARTAVAAGLSAGAGMLVEPDRLVAAAARVQDRVFLPSPRNLPVDTFVVLMMENRSFDHYLGWLPGADGRQAGLSYVDRSGKTLQTQHIVGDFQGCEHPDPDHSWDGGRKQLDGGKCDGFLKTGNDVFGISYYLPADLGYIPFAAQTFTAFDRFHCSLMAATLPNREYMHAAQSYGEIDNNLPPQDKYVSGFPDTTIFNALARRGVSNRYFFNDVPVSALWGQPGLARSGPITEYYERCATGTLPSVSFVDPNFAGSVGEGPGLSGDEHPHGDVRTGQAFMADVVNAFIESPQFQSGALFIVYDEWGGFFDHVAPPRVPDARSHPELDRDYGQMGFRIPAVCVSPWVRRGHVAHQLYGFESILKLIEYRYGLDPLTVRDAYARNIGRSFDFASKPRLEIPDLPHPAHVVSQPCPNEASLTHLASAPGTSTQPAHWSKPAARPKHHDLMELVHSGYLERLGFEFRYATPASTFREPHKVAAAHAAANR